LRALLGPRLKEALGAPEEEAEAESAPWTVMTAVLKAVRSMRQVAVRSRMQARVGTVKRRILLPGSSSFQTTAPLARSTTRQVQSLETVPLTWAVISRVWPGRTWGGTSRVTVNPAPGNVADAMDSRQASATLAAVLEKGKGRIMPDE
jgi:hypothetical protein